MKHIAGREGGREPLRGKRGQNENLLKISIIEAFAKEEVDQVYNTTYSYLHGEKRPGQENIHQQDVCSFFCVFLSTSSRGGNLSNSTTTSSYCSHCNLLVARFLRILIYLLRMQLYSIPCCPSRLSVPSRLLTAGAVAVVCKRLMIWEPAPFLLSS